MSKVTATDGNKVLYVDPSLHKKSKQLGSYEKWSDPEWLNAKNSIPLCGRVRCSPTNRQIRNTVLTVVSVSMLALGYLFASYYYSEDY